MTDLTPERLDELEYDYSEDDRDDPRVLALIAMAKRTKQAELERDALRDKIDSFIATLAQVGATMTLACPECQGRMRRALEDNELWERSQIELRRHLAQPTDAGGA